ncbi:hypothetical protein B1810_01795 [Panacagrimonas perspica]|nr:LuxR C-terminal-related transcriptional regulator [Panacagrimonas perspica]THD05481.1 hypothetical protein B1810_01795 [Panacagrimonas perspica]
MKPGAGTTLSTKFVPPTKRNALVQRPELMARFLSARDLRLQLVCAPAGYGKTSVLAQAFARLAEDGHKVCWVSLDEGDQDLSRFILYLVDAIRQTGVRFGQGLSTLLGSGVSVPGDTLKTLLLNELAGLDQEVHIFLDDYHLVLGPDIREVIAALMLSPMRTLHFLIASRTPNELPVSRLRALGQIHEVEIADLMFTESEVSEFVGTVRGTPLSKTQVTRLRDETEGWAASLQMAGIALRGIGDVDTFLNGFTGAHKSIGDFLSDEVLRRQSPELQEFLIATSILRKFNSGLCDAVMETHGSRAMIDEVERLNLFLFSLDTEHHWYRYHHLFSDFLRRRLNERFPHLVVGYHRRASRWLADHRFVTDAIDHSFQANDLDRAGELLDSSCSDLFAAGQTTTLVSMSSRLPESLRERLPRLQLELAWSSELSWKFADATIAIDRVQAVLDEWPADSPAKSSQERAFVETKLSHRRMMLALLSDDMQQAEKLSVGWLQAARTTDPFMCASAGSAVMASRREQFSCEGVMTSARMLHDRFIEGGAFYGVVFHQCIVGATFLARGDIQHAQEAYERALQMAVELHGEHSALYNMPALMFAELYYERNQINQAEELLAQRDITSQLGFVDNLIAGFVTRGRLLRLRGRVADAETLLAEGSWLAEQYGFARMRVILLHERIQLLLAAGRGKEAHALFRDSPLTATAGQTPPADGATTTDAVLALMSARLGIEAGEERGSMALLRSWYAFARGRHCHRMAIHAGILLAKATARWGDRRVAQRVMAECLALGEAGGFVRSFVDEGAECRELLIELDRSSPLQGSAKTHRYLESLLVAMGHTVPAGAAEENPVPCRAMNQETLSQREIQILELGARGLQNPDIASALFLSESTVKWYWQRIFDKLDTRRRPDAIKRARQMQWIV